MDILYPYINSTWAGVELKYSLRSLEMFSEFDRVFVIGDKPEWLVNVIHIPFKDNPNIEGKERNICNKILEVCKTDISKKLAFVNDDHFLLQKTDWDKYPDYRAGELVYRKGEVGAYKKSVNNTVEYLELKGLEKWNFDIHTPCVYDKKMFPEIMSSVDWRKPFGYVIKSLYFNSLGIEGTPHYDLKINNQTPYHKLRKLVEGQDVFSIGDRAIGLPMKKLFELHFPKKSNYEK